MIAFRLRYKKLGGHIHVRVFAGNVPDGSNPNDYALGNCGTLTLREEEWAALRQTMAGNPVVSIFEEQS